MTEEQLKTVLESTGLPVAYRKFDARDVPDMPFLVYFFDHDNNFGADGEVFMPINRFQVQLLSEQKDIESEAKVEKALKFAYWTKQEIDDDDESYCRVIYELEV